MTEIRARQVGRAIRIDEACSSEVAPCHDGGIKVSIRQILRDEIAARQIVTCLVQGQDRDQRPAAICSVGTTDLNEAMVLNGFALADTFSSQAYRRTEQTAKALSAGYHELGQRCLAPY